MAAPAAATVSLSPSASQTTFGQPITLNAQVQPAQSSSTTPTGSLQFNNETGPLGPPVPVDSHGQGRLSVASLPAGDHTITASYTGDPTFAPAASSPVPARVARLTTQLHSASALHIAALATRLTATLVGADGNPVAGRTVTFVVGGNPACTATSGADGTASCELPLLGNGLTGLLSYAVRFSGDGNYAPSWAPGGLL
jgi:hypothetical protein